MSFKDGDFIKVDYSAWRASDKTLVFTTEKKKAEENKIYSESSKYEPVLIIVGKKMIVKAVEKALEGMDVNDSKKVEVEPKEGFGERSEDLVRVMHVSDFRKKDIDPQPGLQIDIDGMLAVIKSVNSGRVVVDANHPLAGEKLTYEVKVISKIDDDKEKLKALASRSELTIEGAKVEGEMGEIVVGESVEKNADYFINKSAFTRAAFRYMPNMKKVVVKEEYSRSEVEKQEKREQQGQA